LGKNPCADKEGITDRGGAEKRSRERSSSDCTTELLDYGHPVEQTKKPGVENEGGRIINKRGDKEDVSDRGQVRVAGGGNTTNA